MKTYLVRTSNLPKSKRLKKSFSRNFFRERNANSVVNAGSGLKKLRVAIT
jgi:hypothetical protein